MKCPKCKMKSGDTWWQCEGVCPMPMSPHYDAECEAKYKADKHKIRDEVADGDGEMLFCDGLDDALIGRCHVWTKDGPQMVALYDYAKCIDILVQEGASHEEAEEHLQVNTLGSYVGGRTPAFAFLR